MSFLEKAEQFDESIKSFNSFEFSIRKQDADWAGVTIAQFSDGHLNEIRLSSDQIPFFLETIAKFK